SCCPTASSPATSTAAARAMSTAARSEGPGSVVGSAKLTAPVCHPPPMPIGRPRSPLSGTARRPRVRRRGFRSGALLAALSLVAPVLVACGGDDEAETYDPTAMAREIADAVASGLPSPKLTVLATLPHSTDAWT